MFFQVVLGRLMASPTLAHTAVEQFDLSIIAFALWIGLQDLADDFPVSEIQQEKQFTK